MEWLYPIALDLGAKNTGVFNLSYAAGTKIEDFNNANKVLKKAFVAKVLYTNEGGYQFLQINRTANRHAIRCRKRKKQAKKLFLFLLEHVCDFKTQGHQEAINHFLNRRGYNYHESKIDFASVAEVEQAHWIELQAFLIEANASPVFDQLNFSEIEESLLQLQVFEIEELQRHLESIENKKKNSPLALLLKLVKDLKNEKVQATGAKHRRDYFKAIRHDIEQMSKSKGNQFKKLFNALTHAKGYKQGEFIQVFWSLLCHVNNFDLKLLNRIDKSLDAKLTYEQIDAILAQHISHWILKLWQGTDANTPEKKEFKQILKAYTQATPKKILQFLQQTNPEHTVAPYESHTNRKPPYCQTLILNAETLTSQYPEWQKWLVQLSSSCEKMQQTLHNYQTKLRSKISKEGNVLVELEKQNGVLELQARSLQFIFDTSAKHCPYKLSEIWGKLKQIKQLKRKGKSTEKAEVNLASLLEKSRLPNNLKVECTSQLGQSGFWHLINLYYQTRRRTKQGRYFIQRDNKQNSELSKWQNKSMLLQVCQHKPKQLKHQALGDVLQLLGLEQSQISTGNTDDEEISLEKLADQLKSVAKGIVTLAKESLKAQKNYGLDLKTAIASEPKLQKLASTAQEVTQKLALYFFQDTAQQNYFFNRNKSLFTYAQLHSLLFNVERSGFGKTCPLCSADNAARMQVNNGFAQASRLSTMSLRLIDGGLKRLLNHQAHHIANYLWPEIESILKQGHRVSLPLVLEQNHFDFSANLHALKGQGKNKQLQLPKDEKYFTHKQERIFNTGKQLCPYTGEAINFSKSDIDHIIPRSGVYGVLNDEANLIASSVTGNRKVKQNRILSLEDLSKEYLQTHFNATDPKLIKAHLYATLWDTNKAQFVFGQYRQFIALTPVQQTAFRHALFLDEFDELKQSVISAIQHRSKSRVNGTQRFMAQLLADALWQKARAIQCEKQLKFDYFEYSANSQDELSTTSLRRVLTQALVNTDWDLTPFCKNKGQSQRPYSHVIDAMCAMALAVEQHQGEGALSIDVGNSSLWPKVDEQTGEYKASNFTSLALKVERLQPELIVKPSHLASKIDKNGPTSKPHTVISRRIFGENALGIRFYDLAVDNSNVVKGYYKSEIEAGEFVRATAKVADKNIEMLQWLTTHGYYQLKLKQGVKFYTPNSYAILSLMFSVLMVAKKTNLDKNSEEFKAVKWLFGKGDGQLFYYTSKASLQAAPSIVERLKSNNPLMQKWLHFYTGWQAICGGNAKVNLGQFVIESRQLNQWQNYCQAFLGQTEKLNKHSPVRHYTMFNETTSRGNVALQFKQGKFTHYPVNNNEVPKAQSMHILLNSPTLVAFENSVLTKGYVVKLEEKASFKDAQINVKTLINERTAKALCLNIEQLNINVLSNTQINIGGISKQWFEKNLLLKRATEAEAWKKRSSLSFDKYDVERCAIVTDTLKSILNTAIRAERNKSVKVQQLDETVSLGLPVKAEHIAKLLAKQNFEE
ncbi:MAG: hypothetical protein ABJJ44_07695 [Paraglaciecola sp.]|uniref:hypothetical protein n=1 Tax=Paraglaciecola sp. TaxID=1920173 RepID=UPI003299CDAD